MPAETLARDIRASLAYLSRHGLNDSRDLRALLLMHEVRLDLPLGSCAHDAGRGGSQARPAARGGK